MKQEYLKSLLKYDPDTGIFTWVTARSNRIKKGSIAGWKDGEGYRTISIDKKSHMAHRLAFLYMNGSMPAHDVDHVNGVHDDNRWINMREADKYQNQQNRSVGKNNKCGFLGVSWNRPAKKWYAHIRTNGIKKHIGSFNTPEEAYEAYKKEKLRVHEFCGTVRIGANNQGKIV